MAERKPAARSKIVNRNALIARPWLQRMTITAQQWLEEWREVQLRDREL